MKLTFLVLFSFVAATQAEWHNPDENMDFEDPLLVEGDIKIDRKVTRGSIKRRLWPNGIVHYAYSPTFAKYTGAVRAVEAGMRVWSKVTCVKFVKRTNERDYLYFTIGKGCASYVGKTTGRQEVDLGGGCHTEGIAVHEIAHALGFEHEQSRPDRDKYVTIVKNNIKAGFAYNFDRYSTNHIDSLGFPYDYLSIMHYGPYFFSKNGKATIVAKKPGVYFGQRMGPSTIDIKQMRKLYKCKDAPFIEYGMGCKWRFEKAAHRCWRYCNPKSPKKGAWCWTNRSCAKGFLGLERKVCVGSVSFEKCASRCS